MSKTAHESLGKSSAPRGRIARGSRRGVATVTAVGVAAMAGLAGASAAAADELPDGRVYELVTPAAQALETGVTSNGAVASADGNGLYSETVGVPDGSTRGIPMGIFSRRTADGWTSHSVSPGPDPAVSNFDATKVLPANRLPATDGSGIAFKSYQSYVTPDPGVDNSSQGLFLGRPGGELSWITQPPAGVVANPLPGDLSVDSADVAMVGGSGDLSSVYVAYRGVLTAADAAAGKSPNNWGYYVYRNGALENADLLPDGTLAAGGATPMAGGPRILGPYKPNIAGGVTSAYRTVSTAGDRSLFVSPSPANPGSAPRQLYLHRAGEPSVLVSRTNTGAAAPSGVVTDLTRNGGELGTSGMASVDGGTVIFRSVDSLTPDAPNDGTSKVYRFTADDNRVEYVAAISSGASVYALSADGSAIFYTVGTAPMSVRLWRTDGTVASVDAQAGSGPTAVLDSADIAMTANGDTVAFSANRAMVAGANHPAPAGLQAYRWEPGSGAIDCVSCAPAGETTSSTSGRAFLTGSSYDTIAASRGISADGKRIFFSTPTALVPEDTNGVFDAYEWVNGENHLLSTGTSPRDSFVIDNSDSGDDVFIATAESLVGGRQDINGGYDVYDARVDGGFPEDNTRPECEGDACQGDGSQPPSLLNPTSPALGPVTSGPNEAPPAPKPVSPTLTVRRKAVSSTKVTLTVKVPSAGTIRVSGSGLKQSTRKATRSTTYSVTAKLSKHAQSTLRKTGRLKVRARVRFAPAKGKTVSKTVSLTIKRAKR